MADMEPMDLDSIESDFDDKENTYQPNNALIRVSCIEKGYEDLDASEMNMKLRYSITPVSSPMSKSFTANSPDNKNSTLIEGNNVVKDTHNLSQSLNSTMTLTDSILKAPKSLPLQSISKDQYSEINKKSSERHSLDAQLQDNMTPKTNIGIDIDNLSLPSTSSSLAVTPEATTPTKEIPKQDGGSPIMRGLKSVLSMFRSSQSPIPPFEDKQDQEKIISVMETATKTQGVSSTPIKTKNISPLKDSIVFNEDLERDLQWKEDSAVFFKEEKIPIHKLLFPSQPSSGVKIINNLIKECANNSVEYMDVSLNESGLVDTKTVQTNILNNDTNNTESDSEFLDCETTFNKTGQHDATKNKTISTEAIQDTHVNMSGVGNELTNISQDSLKDQKVKDITGNTTTAENGEALPELSEITNETFNINISPEKKIPNISLDTGAVRLNEITNICEPSSIEGKIDEIIEIKKDLDITFDTTNIETNFNKEVNMSDTVIIEPPLDTPFPCSNIGTKLNALNIDTEENATVNFERDGDDKCSIVTAHNEEEVIINETVCNDTTSKVSDMTLVNNLKDSKYENQCPNILYLEDASSCDSKGNIINVEYKDIMQIKSEATSIKNQTITLNDNSPASDLNTSSGMLRSINIFNQDQKQKKLKNEDNKLQDNEFGEISDTTTITLGNNIENNISHHTQLIKQDVNNMESTMLLNTNSEQVIREDGQSQCMNPSLNSEHGENINLKSNEIASISKNSIYIDTLCANTSQDFSLSMSVDEDALLNDSVEEVINEGTENPVILCNDNNKLITNSSYIKGSSISTVNEEIDKKFVNDMQHTNSNPSDIPLPFEDDPLDDKNDNTLLIKDKCELSEELNKLTSDHLDDHDLVFSVKSYNNTDNFIKTPEIKENAIENKTDLNDATLLTNDQTEVNSDKIEATVYSKELETTYNDGVSIKNQNDIIEDEQNNVPNNNSKCVVPNVISLFNPINETSQQSDFKAMESTRETSKLQGLTSETCTNVLVYEKFDNPLCKKFEEEIVEDLLQTKSRILVTPPESPKIVSRGYNFNFDEMDDPFASKTKIRVSPTPESSVNDTYNPISNINTSSESKTSLQSEKPAPDSNFVVSKDGLKSTFNETQIREKDIDLDSSECYNKDLKMLMKPVTQEPVESQDRSQLTVVLNEDNVAETLSTTEELEIKCDMSKENETEYMACTVSDKLSGKNVFNIPEIDDKNFNPFATRSKMCESPLPSNISTVMNDNELFDSNENNTTITVNYEDKNATVIVPEKESPNQSDISSLRNADETLKDINTEDEDTIEGPFLEAEDLAEFDKDNDIIPNSEKHDFIGFNDFPKQINDDAENGEMFIDAEAFEFLLNQNKSNIVADSGKESLFLKFDPLFAKRISSDGILAALNHVQNKQSTPKKIAQSEEESYHIENFNLMPSSSKIIPPCNQIEDSNANISKPTMIVNPAVSSVLSPRKSATPPKINRQSLTFTSPAMAVIDRLLSLSGNTSTTLCHDTSLPQVRAEQHQTDLALTQLREMLAEKEMHVQTLRNERKDLTDRLVSLESQVKTLEFESEDRLRKITDLNSQLSEKNKLNKTMATIVEEYERTIATLVAELEQDKRRNAEERMKLTTDRDEQTAHLASMEISFNDLHSKYEKSKQIIFSLKANEDSLKKSLQDFEDNQLKIQNNYELLKQHATSKLNYANQELEKLNKSHEAEVLKLKAMIKRKDLHITSLEETLTQKTKANEELTAICDELINKVG